MQEVIKVVLVQLTNNIVFLLFISASILTCVKVLRG